MLRHYFPDRNKFQQLAMAVGRVVKKEVNQRVEVSVTRQRFNEHFCIYFPEDGTLQVSDPENESCVGDVVLIKKLDEVSRHVETHKIEDVIHKSGHITDPITGLRVEGDKYIIEQDMPVIDETKLQQIARREKHFTYSHEVDSDLFSWESRNLKKDT